MSKSPAERWLCDLEERTHELVRRSRNATHTRVKIALLDSGIDGTHRAFQTRRTRIKAFKSWVAEPVDEHASEGLSRGILTDKCHDDLGHGTHKGALILRVAPWADLYVGRVADGNGSLKAINVAYATRWAASEWGVDIICLPLGFPHRIELISNAITEAVAHKVVMFAAASNKGLNCNSPAYPARDERVLCINSAHHNGGESDDNPEPYGGQNLATLGEDVTSAWPTKFSSGDSFESVKTTSGTSVATAIAAGLGALLLDFVRQDHNIKPLGWAAEQMRTMAGMNVVLSDMAKKMPRFRYIEPFTYLDGSDDDAHLQSFSRKEAVLQRIFQKLRDEFEYKPSNNMRVLTMVPGGSDDLRFALPFDHNIDLVEIPGRGTFDVHNHTREGKGRVLIFSPREM